ncbi:MAG: DUF4012 domain-containing protein [Acidimicrobiales bacterium]
MTQPTEADSQSEFGRPTTSRTRVRRSNQAVGVIALLSGVAGAFVGAHPTGTAVLDPLYSGLLAAGIALVCSRAGRESLLVFTATAVVMSRTWLLIPAFGALLLSFGAAFRDHSRRRTGAVVGALAAQTLLRWPAVGFHGSTALVAALALIPPCASAYNRSSKRVRRRADRVLGWAAVAFLVCALPTVVSALVVATKMSSGEHEAKAALEDLKQGSSTSATNELRQAAQDFGGASSVLGSWWSEISRLDPVVAQHRDVLASVAATANMLARTAEQQEPHFDFHNLDAGNGQINLTALRELLGPGQAVNRSLGAAQIVVDQQRSEWLVGPLQRKLSDLRSQLAQAHHATALAVQAIPLLPDMLGAQGTRHYLVVIETPAETRGLGGVITGYAEITADNGTISLSREGSDGDLNKSLPPGGGTITGLPDFMRRYGQFDPGAFFQDATFSPDLPTTAQVLSQLYPQAGGDPVDGVIVLDPYGVARLLQLTGPVSAPGLPVPLTAADAPSVILQDQYVLYGYQEQSVARHDVGESALRAVFDKLTGSALPRPGPLFKALAPAVLNGRIGMWSAHPAEESLLGAVGAAESFPRSKGDVLAVTIQNSGANKMDAYVHEAISDDILVDPSTGLVHATLRVALTNDAPSSGLPPIVIANPNAPTVPIGDDYLYVTIYSPFAIASATAGGQPFGFAEDPELGTNAYAGWVTVDSRSTLTLSVNLVGQVKPKTGYDMAFRLQPVANPVTVSIEVTSSGDPRGTQTWVPSAAVSQDHSFNLPT